MFYSFYLQPKCCRNSFILIPFLSCCNRSAFRVYLVSMSFWFLSYSSFLFSNWVLSTLFIFSLAFLLHLFLFLFHLVPKILGRDLLLMEESCNTLRLMRQVSSIYSSSLPWHLLVCCTLPCHHMHFICMFFKTCIRSGFPGSLRCSFWAQTHSHAPVTPLRPCFVSGRKTFSEWTDICRVALVYHQ